MTKLKQKTSLQNICAGEFLFEIFLSFATLALSVINAIRELRKDTPQFDLAYGYIVVALVLVTALVIRAFLRNKRARDSDSAHSLDVVLYTLHAVLTKRTKDADKASLRICVFVHASKPGHVHQITDYVCDEISHGRGRNLPLRSGVVGTAFRSGKSQYDRLQKNMLVSEYLVQNYGFERAEAGAVSQDRKSWAAIPVGDSDHVVAVIYLDSNDPDFFGKSGGIVRKILDSSTIGVARYVEKQ